MYRFLAFIRRTKYALFFLLFLLVVSGLVDLMPDDLAANAPVLSSSPLISTAATYLPTASPTSFPSQPPTSIPTPIPSRTTTHTPTITSTPQPSPTATPIPRTIPDVYDLPDWLANPDYSILAMITDVTDTANQLTFLNADTKERFDMSIPNAEIARFFWMPDGTGFGFVTKDFLGVYVVDTASGAVSRYDVRVEATHCFYDHDKKNIPIVRLLTVYGASPLESTFFCPVATEKSYRLNSEIEILSIARTEWSPTQPRIAILEGPTPNPRDRNPMGTRVIVVDINTGNLIASFEGQYCSLKWSPNGEILFARESSSGGCSPDAEPVLLHPESGQKKRITAIMDAHISPSLDLFKWSKDSSQLFYVNVARDRNDICFYDLQSEDVFCPTSGIDELSKYNVESYMVSPNDLFIVYSYGNSCPGCDYWGEPSSALIGTNGRGYYFIAKEVFRLDIPGNDYPYPYGLSMWRPILESSEESTTQAVLAPLAEVILTSNDFYELPYTNELSTAQLYNDPRPVEKDVTGEVGEYCSEDCAKRIWASSSGTLMIMLVRTDSASSAQRAVEALLQDFMVLGDENDLCSWDNFPRRNAEIGFAENTFLAVFDDPPNNRAASTLITSYGSIYMLVINRHGVAYDLDGFSECLAVQYIGMLQLEKLIEAGYKP